MNRKTISGLRLAGLFLALALTACSSSQPEAQPMTQNEINAKIDSLVGVKVSELATQAMIDLDHRMAIEVKAKADSIVAARMEVTPPPRPDSSPIVY